MDGNYIFLSPKTYEESYDVAFKIKTDNGDVVELECFCYPGIPNGIGYVMIKKEFAGIIKVTEEEMFLH